MAIRSIATLAARILAAAILISPLAAQIRAAASGAMGVGISARPAPGFVGSGAAGGPAHLHRGRPSGRGSLLLPYPYFYSTYANETEEAAPPPVIVVPATAPASAPALPDLPREPLLIEWQGDHFERMTPFQKALASGPSARGSSDKSDVRSSASSAPSSTGASPRSSCFSRWPHGRSKQLYHCEWHHLLESRLLDQRNLDPGDSDCGSGRSCHTQAQSPAWSELHAAHQPQ